MFNIITVSLDRRGRLCRGILLAALLLVLPSHATADTLVGLGGKCVDVEGLGTADGTPVSLYDCNGGENQQWELISIAPFFRVRGLANKCLRPEAEGNSQLVIGACDGMDDRWLPSAEFPNGFTLVHASTGQCMDVEAESTVNGTPINLFPCHGNSNQRWTYEPDVPVMPEPGSLVGIGSKCVDVQGASGADGTPVNLYECSGQENQSWEFLPAASFYWLKGLDGKCLVPGPLDPMGDPVAVIGPCGGLESRWQPTVSFPTGFSLVHVDTGRCLDVAGAGTANRTPLNLHPCNGGLNQLWTYEQDSMDPSICFDQPTQLCLNSERFKVEVEWENIAGEAGPGRVLPFGSDDSGLFWFFNETNWEMLVKVLNGCAINNRYWVFAAATTDVKFTLTITDTDNGTVRRYFNPQGSASEAVTDTEAFATCP